MQNRRDITQQEIEQSVEFFFVNVEFFAAPFEDSQRFQQWANQHESKINLLSSSLNSALAKGRTSYISSFVDAICGKALDPNGKDNSLLRNKKEPIRNLIKINPAMFEMCQAHRNNEVIDLWYATEATEEQRLNRKAKLTKEQATPEQKDNEVTIEEAKREIRARLQASVNLQKYIKSAISNEFNKITDVKLLQKLHRIFIRPRENEEDQPKLNLKRVKTQILDALLSPHNNQEMVNKIASKLLAGSKNLQVAFAKNIIISEGIKILLSPSEDLLEIENTIQQYDKYLEDNNPILLERFNDEFLREEADEDVYVTDHLNTCLEYCVDYRRTLREQLKNEFDKINNNNLLKTLYYSLIAPQTSEPFASTAKCKERILKALCEPSHNPRINARVADALSAVNHSLGLAFRKNVIITDGLRLLSQKTFMVADKKAVLNTVRTFFDNNEHVLAQRRDSRLITFLKIIGVGVATILGLGFGGIVTYNAFFGSSATNGKVLVNEISKLNQRARL